MSLSCKARWATKEHKDNMKEARKHLRFDGENNPAYGGGYKLSNEFKEKCRLRMNGNICAVGAKHTKEWKENARQRQLGSKNCRWKGGITPKRNLERSSAAWRDWRKLVFERDNYTCLLCGLKGVRLEPHHIKTRIDYPELTFNVSNGSTLCYKCHRGTIKKEKQFEYILQKLVLANTIQN